MLDTLIFDWRKQTPRKSYCAFLLALILLTAIQAVGQVTAIKAGRVVDTEDGTVNSNQIILIEKGKITAIGSDVAIPSGAAVINAMTDELGGEAMTMRERAGGASEDYAA